MMGKDGEAYPVCVCVHTHVCGHVCLPLRVTRMKDCTKPKGRN